jgi:glycosyltransferase involved in cell wall biosynthesis
MRGAPPAEEDAALPPILIVTAGGLEHGGGIGRMIGYLVEAWRADPAAPRWEIVDPRGPGPWRSWTGYFTHALRQIARRAGEKPLAYIHVAGRGSTLRKFLLTGFCRLLRLPILLHLHDYDYEAFYGALPAPLRAGVRWMFRTADHVIVLGRDARRTVVERLGVPGDRVSVLPNAVPAVEPVPGPALGPVEILFLGQLSRRKGVHDLIAALSRPELALLSWHATIAGGGPHQRLFEIQLAGSRALSRVALPGWLDRPTTDALLRRADILVLPSYAEGMAMSVLEAMAHGLCIVCTPVGALGEVIEPEESGLLVPPGSVSSLSEALIRAVSDPALRARLGAGALARFQQGYDAAGYPARLMPIIRRALARNSACAVRSAAPGTKQRTEDAR